MDTEGSSHTSWDSCSSSSDISISEWLGPEVLPLPQWQKRMKPAVHKSPCRLSKTLMEALSANLSSTSQGLSLATNMSLRLGRHWCPSIFGEMHLSLCYGKALKKKQNTFEPFIVLRPHWASTECCAWLLWCTPIGCLQWQGHRKKLQLYKMFSSGNIVWKYS